MNSEIQIGDVIEIVTAKGLSYAQYSHPNALYGALLRILPGFHDARPDDFAAILKQQELFVTFVPLQAIVSEGTFEVVANEAIPESAKPFPLFRARGGVEPGTGRVLNWWLWDGEREWRVEELTPEQYNLPIRGIWDDRLLVERIVEGWTPARAEEIAAWHREHRPDLPAPSPDEGIRHFLYFPNKVEAERAATILNEEGYSSEVRQAVSATAWLVLASDKLSKTTEEFFAVRSRLANLAASFGGKYDGWELAVQHRTEASTKST